MKRINRNDSRNPNTGRTRSSSTLERSRSSSLQPRNNHTERSSSSASGRSSLASSVVKDITSLTPDQKKARQQSSIDRIENLKAIKSLENQGIRITPENIQRMRQRATQIAKPRILNDTDVASYIRQSTQTNEGEGIVSSKLKAVGVIIFLFLMLILLVGNFLNENNPLVPLFKSMKKNFLINILDNRGAKILEVKKTAETMVNEDDINNNIRYTFTALHTLLELIAREKTAKNLADTDITPSFINDLVTDYKNELIQQQLQKSPQFSGGLAASTLNKITHNRLTTKDICQIFTSPDTMGNKGCEYSYVNFTLTKLYKPKKDTFFDILSGPFKNYLLDNWLRSSISLDKFLYVFLNITYYGNYQLGFKGSYLEYFEKRSMLDPSLPETIFLMQKLYDNNKAYYPNYPITENDLINMLYTVRYIPNASVNPKEKNSKTYLQDVKDKVSALEKSQALNNESNPFGLYIDDIFQKGFKKFPEELLVNITTTLSMQLQNMLIRRLRLVMTTASQKPEASAMYVLQNGKVLAATVLKLDGGKIVYLSSVPQVHVYNTLKSFLYLTLIENKKDIPAVLLKYQYQNLIFSNKRIELAKEQQKEARLKAFQARNTLATGQTASSTSVKLQPITVKSLNVLENTDIAKIPMGLKKNIAEQLDFYEYNLLNILPIKNYTATLGKMALHPQHFKSYQDIYTGKTTVNLLELVTAYSVFSNDGELRDLNHIESINQEFEIAKDKRLSIRDTYLNLLEDVYFNKIYSSSGKKFFVVFDFEVAIIFNENYTIALWMGNMSTPYAKKDYSELLAETIPDIINELP